MNFVVTIRFSFFMSDQIVITHEIIFLFGFRFVSAFFGFFFNTLLSTLSVLGMTTDKNQ